MVVVGGGYVTYNNKQPSPCPTKRYGGKCLNYYTNSYYGIKKRLEEEYWIHD